MPSFILRNIDPVFWRRVKAKAAAEGVTISAVILKLLTKWLGVFLALVVLSACSASPTTPYPVTVPVVLVPAAITLTGGTATSVDEVLLNLTVTDATGKGVPDQVVTLTSTSGTFNHAVVTTTTTGTGQALLTTTTDATVTATLGSLHASALARAYPKPVIPPPSVFVPPPLPPPPAPPPPTPAPAGYVVSVGCTAKPAGTATPCNVTARYNGTVIPSNDVKPIDWDFGDGMIATTIVPVTSHTYAGAGTYTVYATVTATTVDGPQTATTSTTVVIP